MVRALGPVEFNSFVSGSTLGRALELAKADGATGATAIGDGVEIILIETMNVSGDSLARAYVQAIRERQAETLIEPTQTTLQGREVTYIDLGPEVSCDAPCSRELYVLPGVKRLMIANVPDRAVADSVIAGLP